jgi:hypothetical protein
MGKPILQRRAVRPTVPRFRVSVSKTRIELSIRRDSSHCMISEAIAEAAPHMRNISTDLGTIRMTDPVRRLRYTYLTPATAQRALVEFDRGVNPEPFSFELRTCAQITRSHPREKVNGIDGRTVPRKPDKKRTMLALSDPFEDLGPKVVIAAPRAGSGSQPIVVGGRPPPGNLGRTRKFGLRQLRE